MPDFGQPATPNYTAPDGLATLGNLMSLKQKQQGLVGQQSSNKILASEAVNAEQSAKETQAGASLMSDPVGNGLTDDEGKPTKNAYTIIKQAMPMTGDKHYTDLLTAATGNVEYKNSWLKLRSDVRSDVSSRLAGAAADPNTGLPELQDTIDNLKKDYAGTPASDQVNTIADVSKQAIDKAGQKHGIAGAKQVIMGFSRGGLGNTGITGSGGVAAPSNVTVDSGAQLQPSVQAPALAGGGVTAAGPPINKTIPPGYMMGPNGAIIKAGPGGLSEPPVTGTQGPGASAPPNKLQPIPRPGINAPAADQQKYKDITGSATKEIGLVSDAANDPQNGTQVTRYRNKQILDLADKAPTGPGKEIWNHVASQFPGASGDAYQTIGHYLAQNTSAIAAKMGVPNTNMGAETAAAAGGHVAQNPGAIKEITKVNDAINTAFDAYNKGIAKATGNGANTDKFPAFKQAFGQNFDINVFRYDDALRRKDKGEVDKIASALGAEGMKDLAQKRKVLHTLANTGDLP